MSKNNKILSSLLIVILLIGGTYLYGTIKDTQNGDISNTNSKKEIKIGVISILSGQYAFVGENLVAGARLYEKEWNESHTDRKLKLIVEDDSFDAKKGIAAYKKLTEIDKVDAVYNLSTPTIDAIHDTVAVKSAPIMQLGVQSTPAATDSIYQITPDQAPMFEGFGEFVKSKNPSKPVLLVSGNVQAYEIFADAFKKTYGNIETIKISSDDASSKTLALKLNKDNYTDYIVISSPSEGAMSVKHILQTSKSPIHFFLDSSFLTGFTEYQKILGDNIKKLEGSDVLSFKDIPEDFKVKYKSFSGKDTGIGSDLGYEGVKALVETMPDVINANNKSWSKNNSNSNWLDNMQKANIAGVTGIISFDKLGLRTPAFEIKKFVGGEVK